MSSSAEHRSAVALNNMAISLQERGCDSQALSTFQDALGLLKVASRSNCGARGRHQVIQLAAQRLMKPLPSKRPHSISFSSISDDADFSTAMNAVDVECYSSSHCLLIRIEDYGSEPGLHRDLDLDCAIILHNYGLSYLSMSQNDTYSAENAEKLRRNALKLLNLSHSVIATRSSVCEDDDSLQMMFLLSLIVTKSMAQTLFATRDCEWKLKECLDHLEHLKTLVRDLSVIDASISQIVAPAA